MEERIEIFKSLHKSFLDMLMDDTWLMEEPIDVAETEACWRWAIELGDETVPVEKFEEEFKFSLQDLTNWWNKKVLDLSIMGRQLSRQSAGLKIQDDSGSSILPRPTHCVFFMVNMGLTVRENS